MGTPAKGKLRPKCFMYGSFHFSESLQNDLHIEVAPFETSKSLRLSVIGERIQSNVEIGVLEIELRGALECCTQSLEEFNEDNVSENPQGLPPAYV